MDNKLLQIHYQKNFKKKQIEKFSVNAKSIVSVSFRSKWFLEHFHKISIQFIDENGLYDRVTFKTNNDWTFIKLLYEVEKIKRT